MSVRRFYINPSQINYPQVVIDSQESYHLHRVLRLKPGNIIGLFDGTGAEYKAQIEFISSQKTQAVIIKKTATQTDSPVEICIAQAYLKEKKMDILIRHASELGISKWIPFYSQRSIPKPKQNHQDSRYERWHKIAIEAAKQCGRSRLLSIHPPIDFNALLGLSADFSPKMIFWENAGHLSPDKTLPSPEPQNKIMAIIGPEGGFTDSEIEKAQKNNFCVLSLGPRILKAETAAITIAALLQNHFGDLGLKIS